MEWIAFGASVLTAFLSFLGVYVSNRKSAALMEYRLKKLEEKVGAHNNLEGRVIRLEQKVDDYHKGA